MLSDDLFTHSTRWRIATKAGHPDVADQELKRVIELWTPLAARLAECEYPEFDHAMLVNAATSRMEKWLNSWDGRRSPFSFLSVCTKGIMLQEISKTKHDLRTLEEREREAEEYFCLTHPASKL